MPEKLQEAELPSKKAHSGLSHVTFQRASQDPSKKKKKQNSCSMSFLSFNAKTQEYNYLETARRAFCW